MRVRRQRRSWRENQLILLTAAVTLVLTLLLQAFYHWWTNDSWQTSTLDWVHVPGYEIGTFIQTIERINNNSPTPLVIREVELSGPPGVRGKQPVKDLYDLLALEESYSGQVTIMRFLVRGPLTYYEFAELNRLGPIQDITRRYAFKEISVLKK